MPIFNILTENTLGISHSGEVTASGEGCVELSDEQVRQLVDLIKDHNGETNVEALGLKEKYPEIYERLDEACYEIARHAEYVEWVIDGYESGYSEVDTEEAIALCEEEYGFKFEYDPDDFLDDDGEIDEDALDDARVDAFYEWVEQHRRGLDRDAEAMFLDEVFCLNPEVDAFDYEVEIPEAIIAMAKAES